MVNKVKKFISNFLLMIEEEGLKYYLLDCLWIGILSWVALTLLFGLKGGSILTILPLIYFTKFCMDTTPKKSNNRIYKIKPKTKKITKNIIYKIKPKTKKITKNIILFTACAVIVSLVYGLRGFMFMSLIPLVYFVKVLFQQEKKEKSYSS